MCTHTLITAFVVDWRWWMVRRRYVFLKIDGAIFIHINTDECTMGRVLPRRWQWRWHKQRRSSYRIFVYTNQQKCNGCVEQTNERMNSWDGESYFTICLRYRRTKYADKLPKYLTMHVMCSIRVTLYINTTLDIYKRKDGLYTGTFNVSLKEIES